jgi:hypothetical protein
METAAEASGEVRCPSCSRALVLRSGPKVTAHYAHRPRQSCRNRSGRAGRAPLRLEQLTLFELAPLDPPPISAVPIGPLLDALARPEPAPAAPAVAERAAHHPSVRRARRRRRRRRAWLPRLLRWFKRGRGPASPGLHP